MLGFMVLSAVMLVLLSPIVGVIDAAAKPETAWAAADQSKTAWILVQLFLGIFGVIAYYLVVRPKLVTDRHFSWSKPVPVSAAPASEGGLRRCANPACTDFRERTSETLCPRCDRRTEAIAGAPSARGIRNDALTQLAAESRGPAGVPAQRTCSYPACDGHREATTAHLCSECGRVTQPV